MIADLPIIAIVGRTNVGKSTLFNCLTRTREAIVADFHGVTRDRLYGEGKFEEKPFIVIDTGGLSLEDDSMEGLMNQQTLKALNEADFLFFTVDARTGPTALDITIANQLRRLNKPIFLIINKAENLIDIEAQADFYRLGFPKQFVIAAAHGKGIPTLLEIVLKEASPSLLPPATLDGEIIFAIVGRPNVGKSTLVNRILGEERVIVFDEPGTTRSSISISFNYRGHAYMLIDTAGIRRRAKINEAIEKFSVVKSLQSIEKSQVVVMVLDATEGITEQELHLLRFILESGKALVISVNKWDGLSESTREQTKRGLERRLNFLPFIKIKFISALHGTGVGELFPLIDQAFAAASIKVSTSKLTRILQNAIASHQPPLAQGKLVKLRYAHLGGNNPPVIVIHGSRGKSLPSSYTRYLENFFRKTLRLEGTPIRIEFRDKLTRFLSEKEL